MASMFKEILLHNGQKLLDKLDENKKHSGSTHTTNNPYYQNPPYVNTTIPGIPTPMNYPAPPPRQQDPYYSSAPPQNHHDIPQGPPPPYFDAQSIANSRHNGSNNNNSSSSASTSTGNEKRGFLSSLQSRLAKTSLMVVPPHHIPSPNNPSELGRIPSTTLRVSLTKDKIVDLSTGQPLVEVKPASKKNKDSLNLTRCDRNGEGVQIGTVKFPEWSLSVVFSLSPSPPRPGQAESKIKNEGQLSDKWCYLSLVPNPPYRGEKFCWKMKDPKNGTLIMLRNDAVQAKMEKGVIVIERCDTMAWECIDEILVSGWAVWEKKRRDRKEGEIVQEVLTGIPGGG